MILRLARLRVLDAPAPRRSARSSASSSTAASPSCWRPCAPSTSPLIERVGVLGRLAHENHLLATFDDALGHARPACPHLAGTLRGMRTAKALALAAWLLVIAWLVLLVTDRGEAAGWCLFLAGLLLMVAGPIFQRVGDGQLRITGVIMAAAGLFFVLLGLFYAF